MVAFDRLEQMNADPLDLIGADARQRPRGPPRRDRAEWRLRRARASSVARFASPRKQLCPPRATQIPATRHVGAAGQPCEIFARPRPCRPACERASRRATSVWSAPMHKSLRPPRADVQRLGSRQQRRQAATARRRLPEIPARAAARRCRRPRLRPRCRRSRAEAGGVALFEASTGLAGPIHSEVWADKR